MVTLLPTRVSSPPKAWPIWAGHWFLSTLPTAVGPGPPGALSPTCWGLSVSDTLLPYATLHLLGQDQRCILRV